MPQSHPPRTITLILPPPTASSSSSTASSSKTPAPSLDVLLYAQQLAQEKGTIFDIESFLTPSQRVQYYATVLHRSPPRAPPPLPQITIPSTPIKRAVDEEVSTPISIDEHVPQTPLGTPISAKRAKLPGLAGLHWKKRQKKMAELARLEAEGIKVDPESLLSPPAEPAPLVPNGAVVDGRKKVDVDKDSVQDSASYWNHLLVTARKDRGPQWDYHSQAYHFDRTSPEYYTHGKKPRTDKPKPEPVVTATNSLGMMSAAPNGIPHTTGSGIVQSSTRQPSEPHSSSRASQPSSTPSQAARLPQMGYPGQSPVGHPQQPSPHQQSPHALQQQQLSHQLSQQALQQQHLQQQLQQQQSQQQTYRPPPPPHSSSSQSHGSQTATPGRPTPAQLAGMTPQQLASMGALGSIGGQLNPAMIQMARAAAANAQNGGQGLNQAQLAQLASMGMGAGFTPQQIQAFQAQAAGVRQAGQGVQAGQAGQGGQGGMTGMQGGQGPPGSQGGQQGGGGQMGQGMGQMQMGQMGMGQMGQMGGMGQMGQMQMRPGMNPAMMNGQMFQNVRPGMGAMGGQMGGGMGMVRPPGQGQSGQSQAQGGTAGGSQNWTEYNR